MLTNDFNSNKIKRRQLRSSHSEKEVLKLMSKCEKFMLEIQTNIKFFDWYEKYYSKCNIITRTQWVKEDKMKVSSSHPLLETININHKDSLVIASPFKVFDGNNDDKKII